MLISQFSILTHAFMEITMVNIGLRTTRSIGRQRCVVSKSEFGDSCFPPHATQLSPSNSPNDGSFLNDLVEDEGSHSNGLTYVPKFLRKLSPQHYIGRRDPTQP